MSTTSPNTRTKRPVIHRDELKSNPAKALESLIEAIGSSSSSSSSLSKERHLFGFDISDKRSDARYAVFQDYASADVVPRLRSESGVISHPRDEDNKWNSRMHIQLSSLASFTAWLRSHVASYLKHKSMFRKALGPQRLLYSFGPRGAGRSSVVTSFCSNNSINLYYIRNDFFEGDQVLKILEFAKANQPCVVYFDGAHHIVGRQDHLEYLHAAMRNVLNPVVDDVWIVLSSKLQPLEVFPRRSNIASYLTNYGKVVYTPALTNRTEIRDLVDIFMERLAGVKTFCAQRGDWEGVINKLLSQSVYHTPKELYNFLTQIVRDHLIYISEFEDRRESSPCPSWRLFLRHLENCPRENSHSCLATMRDMPEREHLEMNRVWRDYCASSGVLSDTDDRHDERNTHVQRERERDDTRRQREELEQRVATAPHHGYHEFERPVAKRYNRNHLDDKSQRHHQQSYPSVRSTPHQPPRYESGSPTRYEGGEDDDEEAVYISKRSRH